MNDFPPLAYNFGPFPHKKTVFIHNLPALTYDYPWPASAIRAIMGSALPAREGKADGTSQTQSKEKESGPPPEAFRGALFSEKRGSAMTVRLEEGLIYEILSLVEEIPAGCVASYGQIARLIGRERSARLVGRVLSMAEAYGDYPCHRVVNHAGRLAPHFPEQRQRLLQEGVVFRRNGCVDMDACQWRC